MKVISIIRSGTLFKLLTYCYVIYFEKVQNVDDENKSTRNPISVSDCDKMIAEI